MRRDSEGAKNSCNLFLPDTKLSSREKAKLCFKAVRCKNSEGKFSAEEEGGIRMLHAEFVFSPDAEMMSSLFIP